MLRAGVGLGALWVLLWCFYGILVHFVAKKKLKKVTATAGRCIELAVCYENNDL